MRTSRRRLNGLPERYTLMLARIRKSMDEKDQGFTLIELLVVIIIIGILAAIAIPVFLNQRKKATEASMKSDLRTVANEMETYFTDNQTYPAVTGVAGTATLVGTSPLVTVKTSPNNVVESAGASNVSGTFCLEVANPAATTTIYKYDSDGGGVLTGTC